MPTWGWIVIGMLVLAVIALLVVLSALANLAFGLLNGLTRGALGAFSKKGRE